MANTKIENLGELTSPISTDIIPIVDDPAVTPITKKVTIANLLAVSHTQPQSDITNLTTDLALKAPLTSPTFVTPVLGTPAAGSILTNATGLPATTGLTATGTKDATTFLRGDNTWAVVDASPLTTEGDVYIYTGSANARLARGTANQVLTTNAGATAISWADAAGGGMDPEIASTVQIVSYTPTAATQNATGYMFTRKIDANNDGLYITLWKNGASQVVQIA